MLSSPISRLVRYRPGLCYIRQWHLIHGGSHTWRFRVVQHNEPVALRKMLCKFMIYVHIQYELVSISLANLKMSRALNLDVGVARQSLDGNTCADLRIDKSVFTDLGPRSSRLYLRALGPGRTLRRLRSLQQSRPCSRGKR